MFAFAVAAGLAIGSVAPARGETFSLAQLSRVTHIHGLAVDARDPTRLLVATHHGFFAVSPDGIATRISEARDDFMGFTPHPTDPSTLLASGHPERGGNLGFLVSADGGRSWRQLAKGVRGPVDFHQMDVSKANPEVIYGVHGGLQVSRDGGRTWSAVGAPPEGLIDLAASARAVDTLYAATERGLVISRDGGRSWQPAHLVRRPASLVEVLADGTVYAFIVGVGLVRTVEPALAWTPVSTTFGDAVLLHLAVDPTDKSRLYAATHRGEVLASRDAGRTWAPLGQR